MTTPRPRPIIQATGLTKYYGTHLAVDGISFSVRQGEILGLLGPNGAGKSTTIRMVTGYLRPTSGTIYIAGHDIQEDPLAAKRLVATCRSSRRSTPRCWPTSTCATSRVSAPSRRTTSSARSAAWPASAGSTASCIRRSMSSRAATASASASPTRSSAIRRSSSSMSPPRGSIPTRSWRSAPSSRTSARRRRSSSRATS